MAARALLHFEVLSTIALMVGLLVVSILKPGVGMNVDAATVRRIVNITTLTVADANAARSDEIALPRSQESS